MSRDLRRLAALAAMIREAELARLAALAARRRAVEAEMAALRRTLSAGGDGTELDIARLAGADARWRIWGRAKLGEMSAEAARIAAQAEARLPAARRAVGRADVLSKLASETGKKKR